MAEYETVTPPYTIRTDNQPDNTVENILVDCTDMNVGESVTFYMEGTNPTVRNIGFKGTYRGDGFPINVGAYGGGSGDITIENIYMGDGCTQEGADFVHGPGAMFYNTNASGDIYATNTTVRGWSNNAHYFSNAGYVEWNGCYTVNCGVSHYRAKNAEMHNCVGYNTSNERHGASSGAERYGRIVWAWNPGPINMYDCHVDQGPATLEALWPNANGDPSEINFYSGELIGTDNDGPGTLYVDSSVGSNPTHTAPNGAPLDAETAASGGTSGDQWNPQLSTSTPASISPGGSGTFSATVSHDNPDSGLQMVATHWIEGLGTVDEIVEADGVNIPANGSYTHDATIDHSQFDSTGTFTWEYEVSFPNIDHPDEPLTDSATVTVEDLPTGRVLINHGDGTGEHEIGNIPGIQKMSFKRSGDSTERPVYDSSINYDYDYGWDARNLQDTHTDGDTVSSLDDPAGGAEVTQGTSTLQPEFSTSGSLPAALSFDGSDYLTAGDFPTGLTQPYTIIGVFGYEDTGQNSYAFYGTGSQPQTHLNFNYNGETAFWAGVEGGVGPADVVTGPRVIAMIADGANSKVRIDNYEVTGDAGTVDLNGIYLGARSDGNRGFEGELGTLRCFDQRLSDSEIDTKVSDLATAFNLPMDYDPGTSSGGTDAEATFAIDYDQHIDSSATWGGLENAYDLVEDQRATGFAYLSDSAPATTGSVSNVQGGEAGDWPQKSSNSLVQFDQRVGHLPQEVYFEYDLMFDGDQFTLIGNDTYRFFWNMNRYSGNNYDSTNGNGFSNAIGVTSRGDPASGTYNFFSYTYDSRGASNFWRTDFEIPTGQWFTLRGYCKCNDIGNANAVMKYWFDDQLMQRMDGFQTSADQDGWNHAFGPSGYYTYGEASNYDRYTYFDQPRYFVDGDIPSDIRE